MVMASKHRQRRLSNLKRSFVVTLSTAAASLAGCGTDFHEGSTNPPPSVGGDGGGGAGGTGGQAGTGGSGGTAGTGVGGVGGSGGRESPDSMCPVMPPPWDGDCERSSSRPCTYQDLEQCDGVSYPLIATCENGFWSISRTDIACNPPPPDIDSGIDDEDAGG